MPHRLAMLSQVMNKEYIQQQVGELNLLNELVVKGSNTQKSVIILTGWKEIENQKIQFKCELPPYFPYHKPEIYVTNHSDLVIIPHVLPPHGSVCYLDDENSITDPENPIGQIRVSFERTFKIIADGLNGTNKNELLNEFETYWHILAQQLGIGIYSILNELNRVEAVKIVQTNGLRILGQNERLIKKYLGKIYFPQNQDCSYIDAIYIPLTKNIGLESLLKRRDWTTSEIKKLIFRNISPNDSARLNKLLAKKTKSPIILKIPLPNGSNTHIGFYFKGETNKKNHPLIKHFGSFTPIPIIVDRFDKDYLIPRGGSYKNFFNKKVAIIGCGAIGGTVAMEIVKAGIGNITLIDYDIFSKENLYRHVLGHNSGLQNQKVINLKNEIEAKLPLSNIETIPYSFEQSVYDKKVDYSKFDLVIVAIGNASIEFSINEFFIQSFPRIPVIFTWVEPYGIGGHTLVTNNGSKSGCYHCLYDRDVEVGLYNEASFTLKGQVFTKSIAGCGNRFTPFSSLDANFTALQTVRIAIDILSGKEVDNPLISWKGNDAELISNKFKTSRRYQQSNETIFKNRFKYKKENCSICKK